MGDAFQVCEAAGRFPSNGAKTITSTAEHNYIMNRLVLFRIHDSCEQLTGDFDVPKYILIEFCM